MLCINRYTACTSSDTWALDYSYFKDWYIFLMLSPLVSGMGVILMSMMSFSRSGIFYFREAVDIFRGLAIESFLLLWRESGDYFRFRE